jgi:GvpD gas vesicle protein
MRAPRKSANGEAGWTPIPDPTDRYSTGIPDFDRLLGGGFARGSLALFELDETVGSEDLDLLFFPTFLNLLYQSRGIIAVLPSVDSPRNFRARMSKYVTRRRFDNRVRVVDYIGEDEGPAYVVNLKHLRPDARRRNPVDPKAIGQDSAKMAAAERAAQGARKRSFLEFHSIDVLDTLVGGAMAKKMYFYGVKRARSVDNLVIGLLSPGVECAPSVRSLADTKFTLRHDEVGLILQGVRPSFASYVVAEDLAAGPPHVTFVPRPA